MVLAFSVFYVGNNSLGNNYSWNYDPGFPMCAPFFQLVHFVKWVWTKYSQYLILAPAVFGESAFILVLYFYMCLKKNFWKGGNPFRSRSSVFVCQNGLTDAIFCGRRKEKGSKHTGYSNWHPKFLVLRCSFPSSGNKQETCQIIQHQNTKKWYRNGTNKHFKQSIILVRPVIFCFKWM